MNKIKDILKDKLIIRIDKNNYPVEGAEEFVIIFISPEKKQTGHCTVKIKYTDKEGMKTFKEILNNRFDVLIKGFKNWKKIIKEY